MSLLHVSLILLLIYANKDAKGASLDIDQLVSTSLVDGKENTLTDIVKLEEKLESVVSTLQAEIDANKLGIQNNAKLPDNRESLVYKFTKIVNDLQDDFEIEKTNLESKVSTLQTEVDENNAKLADMEHYQENFETEKARLESTISILQAEIHANKLNIQNNSKLADNRESSVKKIHKNSE